ncbi:MAG: cation diffusion facilitator family transporter [Tannerella sp.]|jgi:cobalt-zinc-cadmium efflux system protein|nr:cation diffusion facilitator family transporter [Tannerella sp.]
MQHGHKHEHTYTPASLNRTFGIGIAVNLLFVAVEFIAGLYTHSMGLLSDAGHNLSDVASLVLAMLAFRLAGVRSNRRYTYGYKKSTVLVSLLNAVILLVAVGVIVAESIGKFFHPQPVEGGVIMAVAGAGILVNAFTAWLFRKDRARDINIKGAYLHMAADALVSAGVVVSGLAIVHTGRYIIDPVTGLVVAAVIVCSTWSLLQDSLRLSLDGVPRDIDRDEIRVLIRTIAEVKDVHHLHIWALSTTETALTAHIVIPDLSRMETVKSRIKRLLHDHAVSHITLEFETGETDCPDSSL